MNVREQAECMRREGRIEEAFQLLRAATGRNDGEAAFLLAHWRVEGDAIRRDLQEACDLFGVAAKLGYAEASAPHIALLANGAGRTHRQWQESLSRLKSLATKDKGAADQLRLLQSMAIDNEGDPSMPFNPDFICQDPLVVQFPKFLTSAECDALTAMASGRFAPSVVINPATGAMAANPIRTSHSAAFPLIAETPFLHAINRRIAAASRSRYEQAEPTQILSYTPGQEYKLHSDALAAEVNQRIQTFLICLMDSFTGGETYFPSAELKIKLAKGDAICFSNVTADMRPARSAMHAGLPVTSGRKVILSKWIRRYPLDLAGPSGNSC